MKLKLLLYASAMIGCAGPTNAHDYSGDLICTLTDNFGNRLMYLFANNTDNADGSSGGTFVETGFAKNNDRPVVSPVGRRPIWIWNGDGRSMLIITSRDAPDWSLRLYRFRGVQADQNRTSI
jgi:hypothetical protein